MDIIFKDDLIKKLDMIKRAGWIPNARQGNSGGIGNTLEDLLGIEENNLPIPNAAEWELKTQRRETSSLTTLFHMEPSPRAVRFVPAVFLPQYGWPHDLAGINYPTSEMSFRQTINALSRTDRGFGIIVDRSSRKVLISFDSSAVNQRHQSWLNTVQTRVGLKELNPQPYWGFDDLFHKAGTKLLNCFFIQADVKKINKQEFYNYSTIMMLSQFSLDRFIDCIENGIVLIDFDSRTGHNHGTKFRIRPGYWDRLYANVTII
ncbi:MvaI/BcnI restriction endonuclease family protein [candidate division KSB1 bacterium]|nr:MvaI/BcnI restriction endonuclease family protein [candidate division KSB1 bacterium]